MTGLPYYDVKKTLSALKRLVNARNSVLVIEHTLAVIKPAKWVLYLEPGGGSSEDHAPAQGAPEKVARVKSAITDKYLKLLLPKSI
jgi:excinuclease ABC subunit A